MGRERNIAELHIYFKGIYCYARGLGPVSVYFIEKGEIAEVRSILFKNLKIAFSVTVL